MIFDKQKAYILQELFLLYIIIFEKIFCNKKIENRW
jgi:hypothetical protein